MTRHDNRLPPLPPDVEAEWTVIQAEQRITQEQVEAHQYQAARERGLTPQEARSEVERHRRRNDMLRAGFDAVKDDLAAEAGLTSRPASSNRPQGDRVPGERSRHAEEPPGTTRERQLPRCRTREEPRVIMPATPGSFSRALSSGGAWVRALGLSLGVGAAVFLGVAAGLHWLFDTATFLTWPTGLVAGWLGLSACAGVLHAASREVREWIRLGGPKPVRRR